VTDALPLRMQNLTRCFGPLTALDDVTLEVTTGSVFGLLGKNGAGKSTAIKLLMGFLHPTRGRVELFGFPAVFREPEFRSRIAYVSETQMYPPWMTVQALVKFHSGFYPEWNERVAREILSQFRLNSAQRVHQLSKGQRRQLGLALALSQGSEFLVLDEPFSGVDVENRRFVIDLIIDLLQHESRTLLITSHILTDLERIVSHVGILDAGRLRCVSELESLKAKTKRLHLRPLSSRGPLRDLPGAEALRARSDGSLTVMNFSPELRNTARDYFGSEPEVEDLSLEEIFLDFVSPHRPAGIPEDAWDRIR
jgi:ABC-2 type transport system ATP-binding protein